MYRVCTRYYSEVVLCREVCLFELSLEVYSLLCSLKSEAHHIQYRDAEIVIEQASDSVTSQPKCCPVLACFLPGIGGFFAREGKWDAQTMHLIYIAIFASRKDGIFLSNAK